MTSRNPKTARGPIRRILLAAILGLVLTAALAGGWAGYLQLVGNIHTVERGELYRSAQLDGPALEAVIRKDGIATVLNLRGANPGTPWYAQELAATAAAGAAHLDLALSANRKPDEKTLRRLIEILHTAPRPLLIHCMSGADRSGLAAALYDLLEAHEPPGEAAEQLSFRYGHFPWLTSRSGAMDATFWAVADKAGS
jgi:protein tyrosine/serine phosphatase